jgi:hypothetical protein
VSARAPWPDGDVLVERYEALRQDVVAGDGRGRAMRGLALLMRRGMAAWMQQLGDEARSAERPAAVRTASNLRLPVGIEHALIAILATMVLTTALEDPT